MQRSRLWCLLGVVLLAVLGGALVAVLVLRPWEAPAPTHQRYPRASVAANGYECAAIGSLCKLPLWSVCMAGSHIGGGLWHVGVVLTLTIELSASVRGSENKRYPHAAVASNGFECASVGRSILEKNGSAVDAAIASLFCEGVACAQCMGLGGGFLATIYDAGTNRVRVINARERAPAATTPDMFATASSTVGGLAIAVPGELRGYGEMYREYGRLPWRDLVKPTADLCRNGHRVNSYMARVLNTYSDIIKAEPSLREVYVNEATGEVWHEGNMIVEPTLAETLDIIAEEGPEAIHDGSLTARLVRDIQQLGGIITEEDLRNYRVEWQEPITAQLDEEHTLYTNPLPGTGSVLAFIMNMLHDWVGGSAAPLGSDLYWHRIVETFKYAYAKRTGLGDPSRSNISYDIRELERNLSNPAWARAFRELVDDSRTFNDWQHYGAEFEGADDHGTAHLLVIAPDGSAVSATSTINYIWGCQRRSRSLGFMLNNEMDDFSIHNRSSAYGLPASPANLLAPGYNPLSSMVPSIVLNKQGEAVVVAGGAGGTKITTQVSMILRHVLLEGQDLVSAMSRPRLHHQLMPMVIQYEADFEPEIIKSLQNKGHETTALGPTAGFAAIVAAARDPEGYIVPHTDKRRPGSIDGF